MPTPDHARQQAQHCVCSITRHLLETIQACLLDLADLITDRPTTIHIATQFSHRVGWYWLVLGCTQIFKPARRPSSAFKNYRGSEFDPRWLNQVSKLSGSGWKNFVTRDKDKIRQYHHDIQDLAGESVRRAGAPMAAFGRAVRKARLVGKIASIGVLVIRSSLRPPLRLAQESAR